MVAAQYILIAGEAIKTQFAEQETPGEGWDQARWRLWAERFREASDWEGIETKTKHAADQAYKKMVALWPELFSTSKE